MSELKHIFGDPTKSLSIKQQGKILTDVLSITIPIIITFSLFNYFFHYNALALIQLGSLLLIVPAWLLARRAAQ